MTPKNGCLLFITSCLSGCGQMYQGYMKRGMSLLLACCRDCIGAVSVVPFENTESHA